MRLRILPVVGLVTLALAPACGSAPEAEPGLSVDSHAEALAPLKEVLATAQRQGGRVSTAALTAAMPLAAPAQHPVRAAAASLRERRGDVDIAWAAVDRPSYVRGDLRAPDARDPRAVARDFLSEERALFGIAAPEQELRLVEVEADAETGETALSYEQTLGGYPVLGRALRVHVAADGAVRAVHGRFERSLAADLPAPVVPKSEVLGLVRADSGAAGKVLRWDEPRLFVSLETGEPVLVWHAVALIEGMRGTSDYQLDAVTGDTHALRVTEMHLTGTGCDPFGNHLTINVTHPVFSDYKLKDSTRPGKVTGYDLAESTSFTTSDPWKDANNDWCGSRQDGPVAGHYNMGLTLSYFDTVHGRNSYDDSGGNIDMGYDAMFLDDDGDEYPSNASSIGSGRFKFGDGDPSDSELPWTPLDVVAHEFGHAVLDDEGISYSGSQTKAIHEAMGDVFGLFVEHYWGNASGATNWTVGEEIFTDGSVVRNIASPSRNHMNDYDSSADAHRNSTIVSYAVYLLWNGGTHPESEVVVPSLGFTKTRKIVYKAVTTYLSDGASFLDLRQAMVSAADALYGSGSTESWAVKRAFTAVGVTTNNMGLIEYAEYYDTWVHASWLLGAQSAVTFGSATSQPGVGYTSYTLEDGGASSGSKDQLGMRPPSSTAGYIQGAFTVTLPPTIDIEIPGILSIHDEPKLDLSVGFRSSASSSSEATVIVTFVPADGSDSFSWSSDIDKDGAMTDAKLSLRDWGGKTGTFYVSVFNVGAALTTPVIWDTLRVVYE